MISLRTEMKNLRIILALACSFAAFKHAAAQAGRAPGTVFRDCHECPEMVVVPAGSFTMGPSPQEKSWAASHGSCKLQRVVDCGYAYEAMTAMPG